VRTLPSGMGRRWQIWFQSSWLVWGWIIPVRYHFTNARRSAEDRGRGSVTGDIDVAVVGLGWMGK